MNPRWEYRIMWISVHSSNESAKIGEIGWRDISLNITLIRWARLSAQFANAKRVDCGIWAPNWTNWWSHQRANLSTDRPTQRWLSGVVLWTFLTGCINLSAERQNLGLLTKSKGSSDRYQFDKNIACRSPGVKWIRRVTMKRADYSNNLQFELSLWINKLVSSWQQLSNCLFVY